MVPQETITILAAIGMPIDLPVPTEIQTLSPLTFNPIDPDVISAINSGVTMDTLSPTIYDGGPLQPVRPATPLIRFPAPPSRNLADMARC
jgi:hypothetical protein